VILDDAIAVFRRLEAEAEEGWPYGYDFEQVKKEAGEALTAIEAHCHRAEDPREEAKAVRARIELVEGFTPTVPTRRERARKGAA
jgi:hypothetical protein